MNLGPHAAFIVAAYGSAAVIVLSLIVWIVFDYRARTRELAELELRGAGRRSERRAGSMASC